MKYIYNCAVFLLISAVTSTAYAGERAGAFSISPFIGGYNYDADQRLTRNRPSYGFRLGYDWYDNLGTEAVFNYAQAELKTGRDVNAFSYRLDVIYNFTPHSALVPYLAVGGGGETIKHVGASGGAATDATFNAGGGLKYFLSDEIALRVDVRHIQDFGDKTYHNWEYSAGISFLFGSRRPAAAAAPEEMPPSEPPLAPIPAAEPTPAHYKYCPTFHVPLFAKNKAEVTKEQHAVLGKLANYMLSYPTTTAIIEGYADQQETHPAALSESRADKAMHHLSDMYNIETSRLAARGCGSSRPVAPSTNEESRKLNRRLEVIVDCAFTTHPVE